MSGMICTEQRVKYKFSHTILRTSASIYCMRGILYVCMEEGGPCTYVSGRVGQVREVMVVAIIIIPVVAVADGDSVTAQVGYTHIANATYVRYMQHGSVRKRRLSRGAPAS